jgi:Domain of unknown function (DUF4158)
MTGASPRFHATSTPEALVEHFLLSPDERARVDPCRGAAHRHGVAVLLKAGQDRGYGPDTLPPVPAAVRLFIAHQRQLLWDHTAASPWPSRSHATPLGLMRQHWHGRLPTAPAKQELARWLPTAAAPAAPTEAAVLESASARLRD